MARPTRIALRLDALPREDLLELAALGCAASTKIACRADAMIAQHTPLASWCVEHVLLSPDLLPHLLASLELCDWRAATTCSAWRAAWAAKLRLQRYLDPSPRTLPIHPDAFGIVVMPNGAICVGGFTTVSRLRIYSQQGELQAHGAWLALIQATIGETILRVHEESLLVSGSSGDSLRRLRLSDGAELACWQGCPEALWDGDPGASALDKDRLYMAAEDRVIVLCANTLELLQEINTPELEDIICCAVCNDELYVGSRRARGEIFVYSLQGERRRIVSGAFGAPYSMLIHEGLIYMVEAIPFDVVPDGTEYEGRTLVVLNMDGAARQVVRLHMEGVIQNMIVHEGEVYLLSDDGVHVLSPFA